MFLHSPNTCNPFFHLWLILIVGKTYILDNCTLVGCEESFSEQCWIK